MENVPWTVELTSSGAAGGCLLAPPQPPSGELGFGVDSEDTLPSGHLGTRGLFCSGFSGSGICVHLSLQVWVLPAMLASLLPTDMRLENPQRPHPVETAKEDGRQTLWPPKLCC